MIVMNIELDNFYAFKNFSMKLSYPKKITGSYIENETLSNNPNFRYKKVNIIMGANATGKTSCGKILMTIFNFMVKKNYNSLTNCICDKSKEPSFSIDYVFTNYDGYHSKLYRVETKISPLVGDEYYSNNFDVTVKSCIIKQGDSYETCLKRLLEQEYKKEDNYIDELEKVDGLDWMFMYPADCTDDWKLKTQNDIGKYTLILEHILKALDPSIQKVEKSKEVENTYIIRTVNSSVIIQDGEVVNKQILSSGTKAGIEVAGMLAAIVEGKYTFYYCDEKFSYIHTDIEKAVLNIMISSLGEDEQLFFTTHNTDILDIPLPKHSFTFLKKDVYDNDEPIKCITASQLLKRNTDSLKNAVENDLFSTAPSTDLIYEIENLKNTNCHRG